MAARWKVKPKGFATVKRDGFWVRPKAARTPRSTTPKGGTVASSTRSAAVNKLVPREYAGSAGVIGGWSKEPRLNPDQYEWTQNESGRWFARPRTELTGLSSQQKADIGSFDAQTEAQKARITEAYNNYATQAGADRDAAAKSFEGLARLAGASYSAPVTGQASTPYGAVGTNPLSPAQQDQSTIAGTTASAGSAAQGGIAGFALSQLPTIARDAGLTALEKYTTDRQGQRKDLLSGYREAAAQAESDARDEDYKRQELAATLRGQNLGLISDKLGSDTSIATASIRADTATADRAAKLRTDAAKLRQQASIARERNLVSRANTLDRLATQKELAAKKAAKSKKGITQSDQRAWTKRARDMWDGIPRKVTGADGKQTTEYLQYDVPEIVRELMAMGASRAQALKVARLVSNKPDYGTTAGANASVSTWF